MTSRAATCLLPICAITAAVAFATPDRGGSHPLATGSPARPVVGRQDAPPARPELVLTANPLVAFAPARVKFTAALLDGRDDYEEFYCASIEWDWNDGTVSQWTRDCQPYKAGRSRIQRQFTAAHTFDLPNYYDVTFRLKKRGKVVAQVRKTVEVTSGAPEER